MRSTLKAIATALALLVLGATPAAAGITLAPSSEWQLREYDDRCRASRTFGEGKNETTVWVEQGGAEASFNLTFIGHPLRHPYGGGIHVRFGNEPEFIRSYIAAKSSKGRPVIRMYGARITQPEIKREDSTASEGKDLDRVRSSVERAAAAAITSIRLRTSIVEPLELQFESFEEPMEFLHQCGKKIGVLLTEAGRPLSSEATPPTPLDRDSWLTGADYPAYLLRADMEGEVTVRLTVSTEGKASSCFIIDSDRPQLFDDAVCLGLLKRARFEPAQDASGKPVASYHFDSVRFFID